MSRIESNANELKHRLFPSHPVKSSSDKARIENKSLVCCVIIILLLIISCQNKSKNHNQDKNGLIFIIFTVLIFTTISVLKLIIVTSISFDLG